jgi:hypothetical protein
MMLVEGSSRFSNLPGAGFGDAVIPMFFLLFYCQISLKFPTMLKNITVRDIPKGQLCNQSHSRFMPLVRSSRFSKLPAAAFGGAVKLIFL